MVWTEVAPSILAASSRSSLMVVRPERKMMKYQPVFRQISMQMTGSFISLVSPRKLMLVPRIWLMAPTLVPKITLNTREEATTAQTWGRKSRGL